MDIDAEGLNKKLIDSLSMQLDSIFHGSNLFSSDDMGGIATGERSPVKKLSEDHQLPQSSDEEMLTNGVL